jgi:mannose-6-phosphate isomerase class I
MDYRKTSQFLMPATKPAGKAGCYDIYPAFSIDEGRIFRGIISLAGSIASKKLILIDGFEGVFYNDLKEQIDRILVDDFGIRAKWISMELFLKPAREIDELIAPFLGGDDPLFGRRCTLDLKDFFSFPAGNDAIYGESSGPVIIYGTGAALMSDKGFLVYFDLPKNELQFRSRAGSVRNLGAGLADDPKKMYKRFYFVDWVVLNRHKRNIIGRINVLADCQRADDITWINGADFRSSLTRMSSSAIRVRPWFEPATWGGSWIKERIAGVNRNVPNYAWSFELIAPENGLILCSSGLMIEFSFDFLMYLEPSAVLGDCADRFGTDFPIRFDFLDTFDGGNLSVQCHPRAGYMNEQFGEDFTQEESYYILDSKENAGVYLGFSENISGDKFRRVMEESVTDTRVVNMDDFVMKHPSRKHDLFLIPGGTIHGSGKNNLVLEISSTPYIFTFKLYDWQRPDLDGKLRPLNIQRGMDNLFFTMKGEKVREELLCKPVLIEKGNDWELFHLPTHPTQLYDIKRYHFNSSIKSDTGNKCFVMSLVEGRNISVETSDGRNSRFSYAETFIIPAAAGEFKITNESGGTAILVMAFVK